MELELAAARKNRLGDSRSKWSWRLSSKFFDPKQEEPCKNPDTVSSIPEKCVGKSDYITKIKNLLDEQSKFLNA